MKLNTVLILAIGAMGVNAQAQEFTNLPDCGKFCISSMFGKGNELGCRPTDAACFCRNPDFMNGVRDCSREFCQASSDADQSIEFAVKTCRDAGVVVQGGGQGGNGGSGPGATGTNGEGGSAVPVTTSTGTIVETRTVETTIMSQPTNSGTGGAGGAGGAATSKPNGAVSTTTTTRAPAGTDASSQPGSGNSAHTATAPLVGVLAAAGLALLLI